MTYVEQLADTCDASWPNIAKARERAEERRTRIRDLLRHGFDLESFRVCSENGSPESEVVVFGSLGRDEWTSSSDVDWTLLVDGRADLDHSKLITRISDCLKAKEFVEPGGTGIFGRMTFSHDVLHHIGGEHDTNRNITQRILLLLEGKSVGDVSTDGPYSRVIGMVLKRYLKSGTSQHPKVPRFLLNDIVRYWRTMCVDFAWKEWEQGAEKWGERNAKLRISRKLIFAAGLLVCLRVDKCTNPIDEELKSSFSRTPLEIMAEFLFSLSDRREELAKEIIGTYDEFLGIMSDSTKRNELKELDVQATSTWQDIKKLGEDFQNGLESLFFETEELGDLTRKYGVF